MKAQKQSIGTDPMMKALKQVWRSVYEALYISYIMKLKPVYSNKPNTQLQNLNETQELIHHRNRGWDLLEVYLIQIKEQLKQWYYVPSYVE